MLGVHLETGTKIERKRISLRELAERPTARQLAEQTARKQATIPEHMRRR
ncbi:hypothetical protein [Anatilimnocola aggregata]|nr:hypothetical protein [Anatilimnocola aggregata]